MTKGVGTKPEVRPRAVMLSKRANVFYLEHVRVAQMDNRIVYLTQGDGDIDRYFNIPERNTAFLLLGKGTSITDAAARRLAESNVMVGFCGSGGSPLFGAMDLVFLSPQSEYRPTEYMQAWMKMWVEDDLRVELGRRLLRARSKITAEQWRSNADLLKRGVGVPEPLLQTFAAEIDRSTTAQQLLLAEARWAKALYAILAQGYRVEFTRTESTGLRETFADVANGFMDHGNYIAYGYAAVALCGLGISFSLPILHGKSRRGALVFDIADLIKDAYVMPLAFASAKAGDTQRDFRSVLIERCQDNEVLDLLFTFVAELCGKTVSDQ